MHKDEKKESWRSQKSGYCFNFEDTIFYLIMSSRIHTIDMLLRSGICGKDTDLSCTVLIRNKDVDQVVNCINVVATRVIITRVEAD